MGGGISSVFSVGGAGRNFVESSRCTATNGASRPGSVTRSRHGTARDVHGTYPTVTSLPSVSSVGALAMIFGSAWWASASAKSFGTLMSTHRNQRVLRVLLRVSASLLVLMVLATTAAPVPAATATTVSWADMTSSARGGFGRCKARVRRQIPTLPRSIRIQCLFDRSSGGQKSDRKRRGRPKGPKP